MVMSRIAILTSVTFGVTMNVTRGCRQSVVGVLKQQMSGAEKGSQALDSLDPVAGITFPSVQARWRLIILRLELSTKIRIA
jgi:hypothetical protein